MNWNKKWVDISIVLAVLLLFLGLKILKVDLDNAITGAVPFGVTPSVNRSERADETAPTTVDAQAGNVSELVIYGYSLTQTWQGFFGNVTGLISLEDSSNNTFYNWSVASPEGEVYATNGTSVTWNYVQCFNFTATGMNSLNSTFCNETLTGGTTNLCGKNLSELETEFGLSYNDVDGVNETFNFTWDTDTHDSFFIGNLEFSEGECVFTRIFGDTGKPETNEFEEVLLFDPINNVTIFAAILEQDLLGFDNKNYDFEMIVLENGRLGDTAVTPYYFYVEIE